MDNVWNSFASLLTSCKTGVLKVVGGTLWSIGGYHRDQARYIILQYIIIKPLSNAHAFENPFAQLVSYLEVPIDFIRYNYSATQTILKSTERYNDATSSWVQGHDMPLPLALVTAEVLNNQDVVLVGGLTQHGSTDKVYLLNLFTG